MDTTRRYSAFGLILESEIPLNLPVAGTAAAADLQIRRTAPTGPRAPADWTTVRSEIGRASVSPAGDRVLLSLDNATASAAVQSFLLGMVMLQALSVRGILSLHGGAALATEGAIGVVARSGAGKSTLLASLMRRSLALLADDLLPIRSRGGEILAVPTYPTLRLWDDTLERLNLERSSGERAPGYDRKYVISTRLESLGRFSPEPAPLRRLYLLEPRAGAGEAATARRLTPLQAFRRLASNRLGPQAETPAFRRSSFDLLSEVARRVPCYALPTSRSSSGLSAMIEVVLEPPTGAA